MSTHATGRVHVFRSGPVETPARRGCEADSTPPPTLCARRPPHAHSRHLRLPDRDGVTRWVRGNAMAGYADVAVRQVTVNPDTVWVYDDRAWERASSSWERSDLYEAF